MKDLVGRSQNKVDRSDYSPSSSVVSQTFDNLHRMTPPTGSLIECAHCDTPAFQVINDCVVIVHRHHGSYHKTIMPLKELGYVKIA